MANGRGGATMSGTATFGAELRRARQAAGLSLAELAERVHFSKGYLSKVENGLAAPNRALATLCDDELDTSGRLCSLLPDLGRLRPRKSDARFFGLPPATGHFAGRGAELTELTTVLLSPGTDQLHAGVCVIDGMAGVGKTALAVRLAHRLETHFEGCLYLDLHGFREDAPPETPAGALDRLLRLLGVGGENIPISVDDRAARYRDLLRGRRFLIVLDNAHGADQVRSLLPAEPRCQVLITSRNRLTALDDAHHLSLDLLPAADAATLFRSVAGPARLAAEEDSGADGAVIATIVQRCGRLPLAVRIAAARFRGRQAWSLRYLDERLSDERDRLGELDDGERSVAAAFRLSYAALPPDQRRMFQLIALHPGPDIDGYAAAALAEVGLRDAERLLDRLLDAHLIAQRSAGRYGCYDLVQVFAAQSALAEIPAAGRLGALDRLLDYYLHTADAADRLLTLHRYRFPLAIGRTPEVVPPFADRDAALTWITAELPNLVAMSRAAAEHGRADQCWQIAFTLRGFFFLSKSWDAWAQTHELALPATRATGNLKAEATTLNNLGMVFIERGDLETASANFRRARALFEQVGNEHGATTALANDAWVHHYRGDHERALRDLTAAYQYYAGAGLRRNSAITLRGIGLFRVELGEFDQAVRDLEASLELFNELGLDLDAAMAFNGLGGAHHRMGHPEAAAALYRQAILLARQCGSRYEEARAEAGLGALAGEAADRVAAREHLERALVLYQALGATQAGEVRARLDALGP